MMDSSVTNLGEVEYDNQNCLRHQKTPVQPKNLEWALPLIATVHKSAHNKKVTN